MPFRTACAASIVTLVGVTLLLLARWRSEAFLSAREHSCEQTNLYRGATENPDQCNKFPWTNFGKGGQMRGDMHVTEDIEVTRKDGNKKSTKDLRAALPDIQGDIRRTSTAMQALSSEHRQLRATIEKVAKKRQDLPDAPIIWPAKATWNVYPNQYCSQHTHQASKGTLEQCKTAATDPAHGIIWSPKYQVCFSCEGSERIHIDAEYYTHALS